jgi:hypothetical protein
MIPRDTNTIIIQQHHNMGTWIQCIIGCVINLYLEMKYPLKDGEIETVHGDQMTTPMCYQRYVKTKQRWGKVV